MRIDNEVLQAETVDVPCAIVKGWRCHANLTSMSGIKSPIKGQQRVSGLEQAFGYNLIERIGSCHLLNVRKGS